MRNTTKKIGLLFYFIFLIFAIGISSHADVSAKDNESKSSRQLNRSGSVGEIERSSTLTFSKKILRLGKKTIEVEIADNTPLRSRGLMHRKSLDDDKGMLFIFEEERPLSFWMKNTYIPLSIAFFNHRKEIINVVDMEPDGLFRLKLDSYFSAGPAQYALEMNRGWFKKNDIDVGSKFSFVK